MQIRLSEKIKELRRQRGISQEVLAQALGVTFQAVSKWETASAMPDVALIPAIASFFGVSTDELFDYNRLEQERRVTELCSRAAELRGQDPGRAEAILRDGLRQFPGNDIILNNLLYTMRAPERAQEVVTICRTLIEASRDDEVKYDALRILAETYQEMGEQALVAPTLDRIPECYFTKLELMARLLEGEESAEAARVQGNLSAASAVEMLLILHDRARCRGDGTEAEKYGRLARGILEVFRREEGEAFRSAPAYRWARALLASIEAGGGRLEPGLWKTL